MNQEIYELLNKQITNEFNAYIIYNTLSYWFYSKRYNNIYEFLQNSAKEELEHMNEFIYYVNMFNPFNKINFPENNFENQYNDAKSIFTLLLNLEIDNSDSISNIANFALQIKDYNTFQFLEPFIKEQLKSVETLKTILNLFDRASIYDIDLNLSYHLSFINKNK